MDVFRVRDRLIEDYREFTGSFVDIHDKTIRDHVAERMARGYQWPDPVAVAQPELRLRRDDHRPGSRETAPAGMREDLPSQG